MTCNIAFTAPKFAAVAADTRIVFGRANLPDLVVDSYEDYERLDIPWTYPNPLLKIRNIQTGWATVCGDIMCGEPALSLLQGSNAESFQQAQQALLLFDGLDVRNPGGQPISESQKNETKIFGAPFSMGGLPVWLHDLSQNHGSEHGSIIHWGSTTSPASAQVYQDWLNRLRGDPTPYQVARCMGSIIEVAASRSDSVSPCIQFGVTYMDSTDTICKAYYSGPLQHLKSLNEATFMASLQRLPW